MRTDYKAPEECFFFVSIDFRKLHSKSSVPAFETTIDIVVRSSALARYLHTMPKVRNGWTRHDQDRRWSVELILIHDSFEWNVNAPKITTTML